MIRRTFVVVVGAAALAGSIAIDARNKKLDGREANTSEASSELRFRRVMLSSGVELQVAESGPANGRPVLFLHGYTDSWFSYSLILKGLPRDVHAIVPTQRGHGDSERPACCYSLPDFAKDAVALLDALDIKRADVVGHSMGSFIAQRMAIDFPARVNRLVLVGSATTVATPPAVEFNKVVQALQDSVPVPFVSEFQASTAYVPLAPEFFKRVVLESSKVPVEVWRATLQGLLTSDARAALSRIQANTLLLWGEHDSFFGRSEQDALLSTIPHSRIVTYKHVGHAPHWEDPARFIADLIVFLREE